MSSSTADPSHGLPPAAAALFRFLSSGIVLASLALFIASLLGAIPGLLTLRRTSASGGAGAPQASAPASGPAAKDRPAAPAGSAAGGARSAEVLALWNRHCLKCHGPEGNPSPMGVTMGARDLTSESAHSLTDADMRRSITEGRGKMPSFKDKLTPAEIDLLIGRVRTLGRKPASGR